MRISTIEPSHASGRHDEAIKEGQIAGNWIRCHRGLNQFRSIFSTGRADMRKPYRICSARLNGARSVHANYRLGEVYAQLGGYDEAIAALEKNRELMPEGGELQAAVARVYALMGREHERCR